MDRNGQFFTLITGASSGIGKAMADELARRNKNLLLISLPETGLQSQCDNLKQKYNIDSRFLEIDLTNPDAPMKIRTFAQNENMHINILINNVGVGHIGIVGEFTPLEINEMIMLNIYSTTHLTNLFLNELKSYPESFILNMGSFGGFIPTPLKSIYMASKAYIYYFTSGLSYELENTSVKVCVAMPGPVTSNKKMINRIQQDGAMSNILKLSPEQVAKYIVPRLLSGKKLIIPGLLTKTAYIIGLILPYAAVLHFSKNLFTNQNNHS